MKYPCNVRIRGVTGLGHWHWLERRNGRKNWGQGQIRQVDRGYTSPWIEKCHHQYSAHCNTLYIRSVQELEPLHREVAAMVEEQKGMVVVPTQINGQCEEEKRRITEAQAVRAASQAERRCQIVVRLAQIRSEVENRAQAMEHLLNKSAETMEAHISAYWSGVLSVGDDSLPVAPVPCDTQLPGKERYEAYRDNLLALLARGLGEEVDR